MFTTTTLQSITIKVLELSQRCKQKGMKQFSSAMNSE